MAGATAPAVFFADPAGPTLIMKIRLLLRDADSDSPDAERDPIRNPHSPARAA